MMDFGFVDNYEPLFTSLVVYCSIVLLYMVFIVNDKSQKINKQYQKLLNLKDSDKSLIEKIFDDKRTQLFKSSRNTIKWIFAIELAVNILMILIFDYVSLVGFIGGLIFPSIAYFILVFILMIAIGLRGQKVLKLRGLIHGR